MKTTMLQGETVSHTPTPWRAIECAGIDHDGSVAWDIEIDGHTVAHVYPGENMDEDAQFIVQAVNCHDDLLEACKGVFALFAQPLETSSHTQWALWNDPETVPEWRALRDAIDRATNRECANVKTREREQTEQAEVTESSAQYFNTLLREAGCKSRWTLDTDETSNSVGTWFCKDTGGVTIEQQMREYTHKLLTLKSQFPDCGDL